jgi:hypothetical protein
MFKILTLQKVHCLLLDFDSIMDGKRYASKYLTKPTFPNKKTSTLSVRMHQFWAIVMPRVVVGLRSHRFIQQHLRHSYAN